MATSSDIRDILQLPHDPTPARKLSKPEKEKRPDGINRELYALIGGAPPLTLARPTYKAKPNMSKRVTPWDWRAFSNPARKDGLTLHHWMKAVDDSTGTSSETFLKEYIYGDFLIRSAVNVVSYFAKFDKKIQLVEYTEEEYRKNLEDSDWSREETDYLFSLCRDYDLRFVVIADRYQFPGKERSMEDIKDRYYAVTRKLLTARAPMVDPNAKSELAAYVYDKAREVERKKNLDILFSRNADQVKEEEMLYHELRRREQTEKRWMKERDALVRLLGNHELQTLPTTPMTTSSNVAREPSNSEKTAASPVEMGPPKRLAPGVHLRSSKISTVKNALQPRFNETLDELGIATTRPHMPTAAVMARYEELRQSVVTLLELKRHVDRAEHEIKVLKERKHILESEDSEQRKEGGRERKTTSERSDDCKVTKKRGVNSPSVTRESKRQRN
ncbi:swr complex subunit [Quaeritorhiza haematococci]|nr:swr complex subunit [Quaeritorhiza haematococci]